MEKQPSKKYVQVLSEQARLHEAFGDLCLVDAADRSGSTHVSPNDRPES